MILNAIAEKLKRQSKDDFKGRHFEAWLIVQAVTWYLRYPLSYRDLEEMFRERGFDIQFQIPIFDGGEVRVRQASETYNQAFNRLTEKAVNVRSEARDAYRVYRSTYEIAGQYQREVLPLRKIITEEMQLRFSSMQVDVFALLTEARQRIASLRAGIQAKRDFWLAQSDLQTAINGGGSGDTQKESRPTTTAQAGGGGGH